MSKEKLTVGSSITESYRFLTSHLPHFFRLIYGPLILWVLVKLGARYIEEEYGTQINSIYYTNLITAAFAIIWDRALNFPIILLGNWQ